MRLRFGDESYLTTLGQYSTNNETIRKKRLSQRLLRETKYKFLKVPEGLKEDGKSQSKSNGDKTAEGTILEHDSPSKVKSLLETDVAPSSSSQLSKLSRNGQYWINLTSEIDYRKVRKWLYELADQVQVNSSAFSPTFSRKWQSVSLNLYVDF